MIVSHLLVTSSCQQSSSPSLQTQHTSLSSPKLRSLKPASYMSLYSCCSLVATDVINTSDAGRHKIKSTPTSNFNTFIITADNFQDYSLLCCDTAWSGRWAAKFQKNLLSPSPFIPMVEPGVLKASKPVYQTAWCHIPKDCSLDTHFREDVKCYRTLSIHSRKRNIRFTFVWI